jgi:hypothetical protein
MSGEKNERLMIARMKYIPNCQLMQQRYGQEASVVCGSLGCSLSINLHMSLKGYLNTYSHLIMKRGNPFGGKG